MRAWQPLEGEAVGALKCTQPVRLRQTHERRSKRSGVRKSGLSLASRVSAGRWSLPSCLTRAVRAGGSQFETRSMAVTLARVPAASSAERRKSGSLDSSLALW